MKNTKALIDTEGEILPIYFKEATNKEIFKWVLNNFDNLDLQEAFTCDAILKDEFIRISGDEDDRTFLITNMRIINLERKTSSCSCSKKEKESCNNLICISEINN